MIDYKRSRLFMTEWTNIGSDETHWKLLSVFASKVRVETVRFLLESDMTTPSDVHRRLIERGIVITLPAVLKHMKILENAGIVETVPPLWPVPDARRKVYRLVGRQRVKVILQQIENIVCIQLLVGMISCVVSTFGRKKDFGFPLTAEERKLFESLIKSCKDPRFAPFLTEDEKARVNRWTGHNDPLR